jgi:hypothetical protein
MDARCFISEIRNAFVHLVTIVNLPSALEKTIFTCRHCKTGIHSLFTRVLPIELVHGLVSRALR